MKENKGDKIERIALIVSIVSAIILLLMSAIGTSAVTTVSIPDSRVSVGEIATIPIRIDDVVNISGSYINISYDSRIINIEDTKAGDLSFQTYEKIDNDEGYVGICAVDPDAPRDGPDLLFGELTVRGIARGISSFLISVVSMQDANYDEINPEVDNGIIVVDPSIALGESLGANITFKNTGIDAHDFDVVLTIGNLQSYVIEDLPLDPDESTTVVMNCPIPYDGSWLGTWDVMIEIRDIGDSVYHVRVDEDIVIIVPAAVSVELQDVAYERVVN